MSLKIFLFIIAVAASLRAAVYVSLPGIPRTSDSVDISTGWNMIGSTSSSINTVDVVPSPGVNITSPFYKYQNGYSTTTFLDPGKAYWVKVSAIGKLYLGTPGKK
jgi:hypothetical protein